MSYFYINTKETLKGAKKLDEAAGKVRVACTRLDGIDLSGLRLGNVSGVVASRLNETKAVVNGVNSSLNDLSEVLKKIVLAYKTTEESVYLRAKETGMISQNASDVIRMNSPEKKNDPILENVYFAKDTITSSGIVRTSLRHHSSDNSIATDETKEFVSMIDLLAGKDLVKFIDFFYDRMPANSIGVKAFEELYGFSEEEAELINCALTKIGIAIDIYCLINQIPLDNKKKIKVTFGSLASLVKGYSSADQMFRLVSDNISTNDAIELYNDIGIDGELLKRVIVDQHNGAPDKRIRDFAHECATYSVMANEGFVKWAGGLIDDIDALVGFKGDIYQGVMRDDDLMSDITSTNLYNRMLNAKDGNMLSAMREYYDGVMNESINESLEFLTVYGKGDPKKGLIKVWQIIEDESLGTDMLSKNASVEDIQKTEKLFIKHLIINSGIDLDD